MTLHGFVDESIRADRYQLALALVDSADMSRLRTAMRALLLPGQREIHMKVEKPTRQRELLSAVHPLGIRVVPYRSTGRGRDQEQARARCLKQLVRHLVSAGGERLVLDSRPGRDQADSRTIARVLRTTDVADELTWAYLDSSSDPLIWVSDCVGWAHGAGAAWQRLAPVSVLDVIDCDRRAAPAVAERPGHARSPAAVRP